VHLLFVSFFRKSGALLIAGATYSAIHLFTPWIPLNYNGMLIAGIASGIGALAGIIAFFYDEYINKCNKKGLC